MIKREPIQLNLKKIECNLHGNMIKYKCRYATCLQPYLCSDIECLDDHFHEEGRLIVGKFNACEWESKFHEVENVLNDDSLKMKEEYLTKIVKYFNGNLQRIRQDMLHFENIKFKFAETKEGSLGIDHFGEANGLLSLGSKIERRIDKLRSKINEEELSLDDSQDAAVNHRNSGFQENQEKIVNLEKDANGQPNSKSSETQQEKTHNLEENEDNIKNGGEDPEEQGENLEEKAVEGDAEDVEHKGEGEGEEGAEQIPSATESEIPYQENQELATFLQHQIPNFSWSQAMLLFSLESPLTSCQKFHEKLRDKKNLLFLFVGEGLIIGSYYQEAYPSVQERYKRDTSSFIFLQDDDVEGKFVRFVADPESEFHISISEKLLICQGNTPNYGDGLRTFQRNFESLVYFLPSNSFRDSIEGREVVYNGMLKVRQFFVLQVSE